MLSGLDEVQAAVREFPPERVAAATGSRRRRSAPARVRAVPSAVAYGRVGVSTQELGGVCHWLLYVPNAVTGNLDRKGGAMFTRPAVDLVALGDRIGQRGHFAKGHSRVRGLPEFGGEWPAAVLAEEMEAPGPGQIRAFVSLAGNPVLSTPNGARLERALPGLDFMVSIDPYLNETSRHAHLVLPPVSPLERDHYDLVFHVLAVRNTARYSPALFAPPPDAREDWQILHGLAQRIGAGRGGQGVASALITRAAGRLGPRGILSLLLRTGPHGRGLRPWGRGLTLKALEAAPHGVDLGALTPALPEALRTADRRLALALPALMADLGVPRAMATAERETRLLIGARDLRPTTPGCTTARAHPGPTVHAAHASGTAARPRPWRPRRRPVAGGPGGGDADRDRRHAARSRQPPARLGSRPPGDPPERRRAAAGSQPQRRHRRAGGGRPVRDRRPERGARRGEAIDSAPARPPLS